MFEPLLSEYELIYYLKWVLYMIAADPETITTIQSFDFSPRKPVIVIQWIPIEEINPLLKVMIETKNIFGVVQEEQVASQVLETSHQNEIHSLNIKISIRKNSIKSEYFFISLKIKADG